MDDDISCRICLEPASRSEVIAPCSCSGSQKWVHRSCLDQWRTTREDRAFSKCTECLSPYELIAPGQGEMSNRRQIVFICYCARDIILGLLIFNIGILIFGYWTYSIDKRFDMKLISMLHCSRFPYVFYYLMGLFVLLAVVGIFGTVLYCLGPSAHACDDCRCDPVYCPLHMLDTSSSGCCGGCFHICRDCTCCEVGACAEMGEAGLVLGAVALVLFAAVGFFVGLLAGIDFIQRVIRRHVHILHKRSLAQEFIVRDLSEDAEGRGQEGGDVEMGHVVRRCGGQQRGTHAYVSVSQPLQREEQPMVEEDHVIFGNLTPEQQNQLVRLGLA